MKIIAIEAENLKRLKAVRVEPRSALVEIAGKNGSGKTSLLDAIWWTICGTKNVQAQPIRKGEEEARVRLDLGDIIVTRRFRKTKAGETATEVIVENAHGARFQSPQAMLDALVGDLAFDPLAFARAPAKQQFDMLRKFVPGVDFDAIDKANKEDFDARRDLNRRAKEARAAADAIGVLNPVGVIDVQALVAEIDEAGKHNAEIAERQARREQVSDRITAIQKDVATRREEIERLHRQIKAMQDAAQRLENEAVDLMDKLSKAPPLPEPIDTAPLRVHIQKAEDNNRKAESYMVRQRHVERAAELEAEADKLTQAMADRKAAKEKAIAEAAMPVPGLSFGEDGGVLLNGVPFDQASDAEQLRASVAIAAAMNPKLRVIRIRDGSLLDDDAMKALEEMASEREMQVWIERVGERISGKFGVVIRDGSVASVAEVAE